MGIESFEGEYVGAIASEPFSEIFLNLVSLECTIKDYMIKYMY